MVKMLMFFIGGYLLKDILKIVLIVCILAFFWINGIESIPIIYNGVMKIINSLKEVRL